MKNKKENLKGMKGDELLKQLTVLREELRSIHFKAEGARSKNVKESATLKKRIAQVLTEINKPLYQVSGKSQTPGVGVK